MHAWDAQCQTLTGLDFVFTLGCGLFFLFAAVTSEGAGGVLILMGLVGLFMVSEALRMPSEYHARQKRIKRRKRRWATLDKGE